MSVIAKYKFDHNVYADLIPEFNSEFTEYTYTDEVAEDDSYTIRTIESENLPTLMRFGQAWVDSDTDTANADRCNSLLEILEMNTSALINCHSMFRICKEVTSIECEWDTSNVTSMSCMFECCYKLLSLDVSNFDTSNVTTMGYMFCNCRSLTSLDVSNFNTSNVTDMQYMFCNCYNLTSLDLSNFNTSKVTNMQWMFAECYNLTSLDVSNFDTSKVTNINNLFYNCNNLTSINVSNFNTSNVTNMYAMFSNCNNLTSLDVSNFNTSKVTNMTYMFFGCKSLTTLDVSNFDTSKVTDMGQMFNGCTKLTSLDVSSFDTSNVTNMGGVFAECNNLTSLDVSNFDTSKVTTMHTMFYNCQSLTSLDVSNFDTSKVTDMSSMFFNCYNLTSLDLGKWNVKNGNLYTMNSMFYECKSLKILDISNMFFGTMTKDRIFGLTTCVSLDNIGMVYCDEDTINRTSALTHEHNTTIWVGEDIDIKDLTSFEHITYKQYTKKIEVELNNPLLEGDELVVKDGKLYHYHKMGKVVLDGSDDEVWSTNTTVAMNNTSFFQIEQSMGGYNNFYCDKFKVGGSTYSGADEGISTNGTQTHIQIRISDSKLLSIDVDGFKQWLSENPTTVVYELETPYYELISDNPLDIPLISETVDITNSSLVPLNMKMENSGMSTVAISTSSTYTVAFDKEGEGDLTIDLCGSEVTTSDNVVEITTPSELENEELKFIGEGIGISNVRLLEGSVSGDAIPRETFEGLKNSFDDGLVTDYEINSGLCSSSNLGKYRIEYNVTDDELEEFGVEVDFTTMSYTRLNKTDDDFTNVYPYNSMKKCNILNGKIVAYEDEEGFIEDGTNGDVMVEIPKFYYKVVPLETEDNSSGEGKQLVKAQWWISNQYKDGYKIHPMFTRNGKILEHFYISSYEGSLYDTSENTHILDDSQVADFTVDTLSSIKGAKPISGVSQNLTITNAELLCTNKGTNYLQYDFAMASGLQLLMLIEYNTFDIQSKLGNGVVSVTDDGSSNCSVNTGSDSCISYHGIENPYGNIWKFVSGLNIYNYSNPKAYWSNDNKTVDTSDNHNEINFNLCISNGYISRIGYDENNDFVFLPTKVDSSNNIKDYYYQNTSASYWTIALLGGAWHSGSAAGAFCWNVGSGSSYRSRDIGCRLAFFNDEDIDTKNKIYYLDTPFLEGDTIEDINGVATHVKRYGKVVLDGSDDENWAYNHSGEGYFTYYIRLSNFDTRLTPVIISDNFAYIGGGDTLFLPSQGFKVQPNYSSVLYLCLNSLASLTEVKQWLSENPTTVVYQLLSPIYEPISNESILCDSYVNGHLDVDTNIPIERVEFRYFEKELAYLQSSTTYVVQFEADNIGECVINLGGTDYTTSIISGINICYITTPSTLSHQNIIINGIGFNAFNIQVIATDRIDEIGYFKGLQNSFENCLVTDETDENHGRYAVECTITNEDNSEMYSKVVYLNSPLLKGDTIEIYDGKLCHYHKMGMVVLDGDNQDNKYKCFSYRQASTEISYAGIYINDMKYGFISEVICDKFKSLSDGSNYDITYKIEQCYPYQIQSKPNIGIIYFHILNSKLSEYTLYGFKAWLSENPTTVIYELAEPYYEEITPTQEDLIITSVKEGDLHIDTIVPISSKVTYNVNVQLLTDFEQNIIEQVQQANATDLQSILDEEIDN